jgi:hypothetical protein
MFKQSLKEARRRQQDRFSKRPGVARELGIDFTEEYRPLHVAAGRPDFFVALWVPGNYFLYEKSP